MKKSTYALIALVIFVLLAEIGMFLLIHFSGRPRSEADWPQPYKEEEAIELSTLTVDLERDWYVDIPYGATTADTLFDQSQNYDVDTLIIIAPKGAIHIR